MHNFHQSILPDFIAINLVASPVFTTNIVSSFSGREMRQKQRSSCYQKYCLKDARLSQEQFNIFNSFFRNRHGSLYSFLLKDYADCQLTNQSITYDENIKAYKVYKTYFDGHFEYIRHLAFLNRDRLAIRPSPQIIDYENAIIYMEENHKENIIIDGEFYVKARFSGAMTLNTHSGRMEA
ncbi:MAG UNVERIFIED_CONTAM: DUF2460 domain-containing protein [Rickettsiaceae bacterium]|jgi:uncharacterized protein (TIGR02217 family)